MAALLREAMGASLRRVRTTQHRTLRQVSADARVSLGYLSEVERGQKEASSELLASICSALDIDIADVLFDAGSALRGTSTELAPTVPTGAIPARVTSTPADRTVIAADTRVVIPAPTDRRQGALTSA